MQSSPIANFYFWLSTIFELVSCVALVCWVVFRVLAERRSNRRRRDRALDIARRAFMRVIEMETAVRDLAAEALRIEQHLWRLSHPPSGGVPDFHVGDDLTSIICDFENKTGMDE